MQPRPSVSPDSRPARIDPPVPLRSLPQPQLGSRYRIRKHGGVRHLTCVEAPTISVRIEPGKTASAQEARNAPGGTIYLDGAAEGEPFADPVRRIYNLDHHEGCVRAFTLSACEQAMVLVRKGLELRSRDWTVHANDADLDAVLAIWVLLNHLRLADASDPVRSEIMPLLRLEGAIDAHGLDLQDLCALPPALLDETQRRMDRLRDHERSLKARNRWQKVDLLEYVSERLAQIDNLVYPPSTFDDIVDIEELGRVEIGDRSVALACRARVGIYEVERQLRRLHGPRLGMIVLKQRRGVYTLRQVDPSLAAGLDSLYAHLNLIDAAAGSPRSGNRWGGSGEIGGSPRSTGTKLSTQQVLDACRHAYAPTSLGRRVVGALRATLTAVGVLGGTALVAAAMQVWLGIASHAAFGYALGGVATFAFLLGAAQARCVYGLRLPRGTGWIPAIPFAAAGALMGGQGLAGMAIGGGSPLLGIAAAAPWLAAIVGSELLFRGLVHGQLVWAFGSTPARRDGREALLRPAVLAAVLSTAAALVFLGLGTPAVPLPDHLALWPVSLAGALTIGLAAGLAREGSESVLGAIAVYAVAAVVVALPSLLGLA